ncbi:MAG: hypothetical protein K9W43_11330 [Candidatus Thorarchaeota archaeon]|nr:hypothetical protein [Candidatus Thorarchaeota archaeon]
MVTTFILVFVLAIFSSNFGDFGYVVLADLYISGSGLIGSYVTLLVLFMVVYPEIYYQFNAIVLSRKLKKSSVRPSEIISLEDSESSIYMRLKTGLSGLLIIAAMAFIPLIFIDQFQVNDSIIQSHVGLFMPFIFIRYSVLTATFDIVAWSVLQFLIVAVEMSGDFLFVRQFIKYLLNESTKLRLLLVTIISYWVTIAQIGFSFATASSTSGPFSTYSFLAPLVQVVGFLLLQTGILKRADFKIEPDVAPETVPPTSTTEILVRVPITYLIKSKIWSWKYGRHKRSD